MGNFKDRKNFVPESECVEFALKKSSFGFYSSSLSLLFLLGGLAFLVSAKLLQPVERSLYIEKAPIIQSFKIAVNNGATLKEIKHLFEQQKRKKRQNLVEIFMSILARSKYTDGTYYISPSLSFVLQDLVAREYLQKTPDSKYIDRLKVLLRIYETRNPFEKLEVGQRQYFKNIEAKLSADVYKSIQVDLNKVADQLDNKNHLVSEYLADSTYSFRISIAALFLSLLLGLFQLYLGRKKRTHETIVQALQTYSRRD